MIPLDYLPGERRGPVAEAGVTARSISQATFPDCTPAFAGEIFEAGLA